MLKIMCLICICLVTLPVLCETAANYEVATITDVKRHLASDGKISDAVSYDVSVRVADTIYLVLYTDTLGTNTVKYAAGRELLVHVGKNTITYNDILGQSHEVPIISQRPVINTGQFK